MRRHLLDSRYRRCLQGLGSLSWSFRCPRHPPAPGTRPIPQQDTPRVVHGHRPTPTSRNQQGGSRNQQGGWIALTPLSPSIPLKIWTFKLLCILSCIFLSKCFRLNLCCSSRPSCNFAIIKFLSSPSYASLPFFSARGRAFWGKGVM